ncbi:parathyroid hormone 4-like [Spea bombifrons]|uniref:parathyroid hormone 4-like n=1 Tax=Spea bombifrons TaxID=233779 RepID=UPI002349BB52|nr:parathyroid hormone 4-like [Spea bombifrons]
MLSQKYLQLVAFLGIVCFACLTASENQERERSVAEAQLMHDKGKTIEELNRQRWLQGILGSVHNPGRREVSPIQHSRRDTHGNKDDQQQIDNMKNVLQYKGTVIARSKKIFQ